MDQIRKRLGPKSQSALGNGLSSSSRKKDGATRVGTTEAAPAHDRPPEVVTAFESILFPDPEKYPRADDAREPDCFADLNLDQVIAETNSGRDEYSRAIFIPTSPPPTK